LWWGFLGNGAIGASKKKKGIERKGNGIKKKIFNRKRTGKLRSLCGSAKTGKRFVMRGVLGVERTDNEGGFWLTKVRTAQAQKIDADCFSKRCLGLLGVNAYKGQRGKEEDSKSKGGVRRKPPLSRPPGGKIREFLVVKTNENPEKEQGGAQSPTEKKGSGGK